MLLSSTFNADKWNKNISKVINIVIYSIESFICNIHMKMYVVRRIFLKFYYFFQKFKTHSYVNNQYQPEDYRGPRYKQGELYFLMDTVALFVTPASKIIQRYFCLKLVCHCGICAGCLNLSRQWSEDVSYERSML